MLDKLVRLFVCAALCAVAALATAAPAAAQAGMLRDSETEEMLRDFATPVWRAADLNPDDVHIYLLNDPSLNAFVAGGENIFVHTGLLLAVQKPNELIGVVAHETGHITGGHLVRSNEAMRRSMGPAIISIGLGILAIAAGAPDAGATLIGGSSAFAQGNFVRHTQVQESSADQAAMTYLDATGQSGDGLIDFFNRELRRYEFDMRRAPPYLISHPFTSDRVLALRARVAASSSEHATDTPENIERLRMVQAKLYGYLSTSAQTLIRYPMTDTSLPAHYARALAAYRNADIPRATGELHTLIAAQPNNPFFHELYGQLLFENGRSVEAIPESRRALELRPNDPLLMVALARALAASERRPGPATQEAIALLDRATRIEPDNAFAWRELASAHDARGEEGLARLASAEQSYATGDFQLAMNFATRARQSLPQGQPSWQRASDIVSFSQSQIRDNPNGRRS